MNKPFVSNENFGTIIPNLKINGKPAPYPVVNDREVRSTAGVMLLIGSLTFFYTWFTHDFSYLKIVLPFFFIDFLLKASKGPKRSLFGLVGRRFVANQKPEYVGAIQKRFAWGIGLAVSTLMMYLIFIAENQTRLPLYICALCLSMMWLESTMGICVGCHIYNGLIKFKLIKRPKFHPACPGGVCDTNDKNDLIEMY